MNAQQLLCHVSILWFLSFHPQSSSRTQSQQYAEPPALPNGWQIASVSTGQSPGTGEEQGWFPTLFWIYLGPHSPSKLKCPPFWDTSIFALYIHDFAFYFLNFIYSWLCWVFIAVGGGGDFSSCSELGATLYLWCLPFSLQRLLLLESMDSRAWASAVVAYGLSCPGMCGIFPNQGLNPRPLHWRADS